MLLDKNVTPQLDLLYHYALQLVAVKEHAGAARLLKILTLYDAWSFDYWFQLGVCCQAQKAWSDAIYAYGRAAQIQLDEPRAPWRAAECYLACGNDRGAKKALKAVMLICGDNREHQILRRRAEAVLLQISDRIKQ